MNPEIYKSTRDLLARCGADHSVFRKNGHTYLSNGRDADIRRHIWLSLHELGYGVNEIARSTSANPSTVSVAIKQQQQQQQQATPKESPVPPSPQSQPSAPAPARPYTPPPPAAPRMDIADNLFGWQHARILIKCEEAQPDSWDYSAMLKGDHRTIGYISMLTDTGYIRPLSPDDDGSGRRIEITKAGRIALKRWLKDHPVEPDGKVVDAQIQKLASEHSRRANGIVPLDTGVPIIDGPDDGRGNPAVKGDRDRSGATGDDLEPDAEPDLDQDLG